MLGAQFWSWAKVDGRRLAIPWCHLTPLAPGSEKIDPKAMCCFQRFGFSTSDGVVVIC